MEGATLRLSCRCKVPDFGFRLLLSGQNNFSQGGRVRGQPAGQDSTVAAVSDRREAPCECVCYTAVSNTCLNCDKYLQLVSLQLPAGLLIKPHCSHC